jgi:hypothetical protein
LVSLILLITDTTDPERDQYVEWLTTAWEYFRWLFEIEWMSAGWDLNDLAQETVWYEDNPPEVGSEAWYAEFAAAQERFWKLRYGEPAKQQEQEQQKPKQPFIRLVKKDEDGANK